MSNDDIEGMDKAESQAVEPSGVGLTRRAQTQGPSQLTGALARLYWDCPKCDKLQPQSQIVCECGFQFSPNTGISLFEPLKPSSPRPGLRLFSRLADMWVLAGLLAVANVPSAFWSSRAAFLVLPFIAVFSDIFWISTWGTTPGKWLFNIRIRRINGNKLDLYRSAKRAVGVYIFGQVFGIFPASAIAAWVALRNIDKEGIASWDLLSESIVQHRKLSWLRIFALVALPLLLMSVPIFVRD